MENQPSEIKIQHIVALIERLVNPVGMTEKESHDLLDKLLMLVPHPGASDLIFWPKKELSMREIAIEMLTYRPVPLGYTP